MAGLKPYEIITTADGRPVADLREFEKVLTPAGEQRLHVKRMAVGRFVQIRSDGPS